MGCRAVGILYVFLVMRKCVSFNGLIMVNGN